MLKYGLYKPVLLHEGLYSWELLSNFQHVFDCLCMQCKCVFNRIYFRETNIKQVKCSLGNLMTSV